MTVKTLYRYNREENKTTISTETPSCEYTELFRIIADENKMVTLDGEDLRTVVDVDDTTGWYEVDASSDSETVLKAQAYDILMGNEVSE